MGAFFYHFWTHVWPRIGKNKESDLGVIKDAHSEKLIKETANAIEGFVNLGCIAMGMLQIIPVHRGVEPVIDQKIE